MNVMNATHHVTPGDLTQFKPLVQQMEKEGKLEVIEDFMVANYLKKDDGQVYVLKKIK